MKRREEASEKSSQAAQILKDSETSAVGGPMRRLLLESIRAANARNLREVPVERQDNRADASRTAGDYHVG